MVCSSDEDIDFFNIVAGVLLGDTLAPYSFILCLDYIFVVLIVDLIKENSFTLKKARSRQYPAETEKCKQHRKQPSISHK